MLVLLTGENTFEIYEEISSLRRATLGDVSILDASSITPQDLTEIFLGQSLFTKERLIIIDTLSGNKDTWDALNAWVDDKNDDTTIVLIEPTPDRRTKTYKALVKTASVKTFKAWSRDDSVKATQWVLQRMEDAGRQLTQPQARRIVQRSGVNQWQLFHELAKLLVLDEITEEIIDAVIEPHVEENIFALLETALRGDAQRVQSMLQTLRKTEDPYRMFGLLSTQILQLATIGYSNGTPQVLALKLGLPSFVLARQIELARQCSQRELRAMLHAAALSDVSLKKSLASPWVLIEQLLLKISYK